MIFLAEFGPAYYAIITGPLLDNRTLSDKAKLLFASITSLTDSKGYCWASNKYLADRFGCGERTVSRWVAQLQEEGFLQAVMVLNEKTGQMERRIYIGNEPPGGVAKSGDTCQKWRGGVAKSGEAIIRMNKKEEYTPLLSPHKQGTRKREPKKTADWLPERFESFWAWYRVNVCPADRQAAIRAWDKLQPDEALIARIGRALQKQVVSELWASGKGRPYASTYLNNARWEDAEGLPEPAAQEARTGGGYGWE